MSTSGAPSPVLSPTAQAAQAGQQLQQAWTGQTIFRAEVSIERLVAGILVPTGENNVPQVDSPGELRVWAVLSFGESLVKTVVATVALLVMYIAEKTFGDWDCDPYKDAAGAHFTSLWLSGLMVFSPQTAVNQALGAEAGEQVGTYKISRYADSADGTWGTVGDLRQVPFYQKLRFMGPVN